MNATQSLAAGAAGAATVTMLNETFRRIAPAEAPHIEITGMRGVAAVSEAAGVEPPRGDALFGTALAGDLVSNTLYFALAGAGSPDSAVLRGALLGAAAGIGAITLPPVLGLGARPTMRTPLTAALTFAWYFAGGLAAGAIVSAMARNSDQPATA